MRDNRGVGDLIEVFIAPVAHYELSRRSRYGYGLVVCCKGNSSGGDGGVKEPGGREQRYSYQSDSYFCLGFHFLIFVLVSY